LLAKKRRIRLVPLRRKGLVRYLASAACARVQRRVGLPPIRRNRFGGLPYDLARQSFAVVNFSVLGLEDLDRLSARWGQALQRTKPFAKRGREGLVRVTGKSRSDKEQKQAFEMSYQYRISSSPAGGHI